MSKRVENLSNRWGAWILDWIPYSVSISHRSQSTAWTWYGQAIPWLQYSGLKGSSSFWR